MKSELLHEDKIDEMFHNLLDKGCVASGCKEVNDFFDELGELLHFNENFSHLKEKLRTNPEFRKRFEEELKRVILKI